MAEKLVSAVSKYLTIIGAILIAVMVLHVTLDTILRYFFRAPLSGTIEIVARYYVVATIFLPLAWCQLHRGHFRVDLFDNVFSRRYQKWTDVANDLIVAFISALMAWQLGLEAARAASESEFVQTVDFMLPTWPSYWIAAVGAGALGLVAILQAASRLKMP